jgi:hypothetical protein
VVAGRWSLVADQLWATLRSSRGKQSKSARRDQAKTPAGYLRESDNGSLERQPLSNVPAQRFAALIFEFAEPTI